jgi:hypothetical protein
VSSGTPTRAGAGLTDPTDARATGRATRGGAVLLVVMLLVDAIAVNVIQFRGIDRETVDSFDAVHRFETGDIMELGYRECAWCRQRYGLHLALQVIAPGSRVIVPASSPYAANRYLAEEFTLRLYALGRVATVDWVGRTQDPELLTSAGPDGGGGGLDPTPFVVASGRGGERGAPWALAVDGPAPTPPGGSDPDDYLAQALRDGGLGDADAPPREFVILQWRVPREGSRYDYQDLVLDTSLLPDSARARLTGEGSPR